MTYTYNYNIKAYLHTLQLWFTENEKFSYSTFSSFPAFMLCSQAEAYSSTTKTNDSLSAQVEAQTEFVATIF